jgi:hypothetical protein
MTIDAGQGTTMITAHANSTPSATPGSVSVAATNVCGTGVARSVTLTNAGVLPGAITGPISVCGASSATYSIASLGAGYTYNWSISMVGWHIGSITGPITLTTSATTITLYGPATGASTAGLVKVTSTNACGATSGIRTLGVTYCHSGIANGNTTDNNGNVFSSLYPNPTSSDFKIDVTSDIDREITVQVYDVLGNLIINEKHEIAIGTSTMTTNIESYKAGMYFVRLVDSNATTIYSQTVLKQ